MTAPTLERPTGLAGLTDEQIAGLELLRQEVPEKLIGKLPKVTCRDCSKNSCQKHSKTKCRVCNAWISSEHIHLDFVGHAETTSQFLEADLQWNWEPMGFDANGLPAFDDIGGLWIRLTICGVTRIGYGTADNANNFKAKGDIRKEIIGDALRNAGMRFGHALNLWAKTDIHERRQEEEPAQQVQREQPKAPREDEWSGPAKPPVRASEEAVRQLNIRIKVKFGQLTDAQRLDKVCGFIQRRITSTSEVFEHECAAMLKSLAGMPNYVKPEPTPVPLKYQQAEDPETLAAAQSLMPFEAAHLQAQIEESLLDAIQSAASPDELGKAWSRAQAMCEAQQIGTADLAALRGAYEVRAHALADIEAQALMVRQPQEAGV